MTNEEKAVLKACERRFVAFMKDHGLKTASAVLKQQRGKKTLAAQLIRACAKWQMSKA